MTCRAWSGSHMAALPRPRNSSTGPKPSCLTSATSIAQHCVTRALARLTSTTSPDRTNDMIVTGGENVYSGEVEAVLYEHPAVREAAVVGIPDPQWGELVMACVVLKPGEVLSASDLMAYCRRSLANYKTPRRVEFLDTDLPKSGSGKILKRILRERFWAHQERAVN